MDFYYTFTALQDMKQTKELIDFMASQSLDYPNYNDWLQKTENQLEKGEKEAILAFSEGKLVANLVSQTCRDNGLGFLKEIKNARVHPEMRDRYFMKFLLRQLYKECEEKYDGLIGDVRANQTDTINYLVQEGFIPVAKTTLYESSMEEITLFKPLRKRAEFLVPNIKKVIIAKSL